MILLALAQQTSGTDGGGILASLLVTLIWMGFFVALLGAWWRIFVKAGHPGWAALIPIYNIVVMLRIVQRPGWWLLLLFIPFINPIIFLLLMYDLARVFGRGIGFTLGLICLNPVFILLLGFGSARYLAAGEQPAAQPLAGTNALGAPSLQLPAGMPALPQPRAAAAKPTNLGSPVEIAAAVLAILLLFGMLVMLLNLLGGRRSEAAAFETRRDTEEVVFESPAPSWDPVHAGTIDIGGTPVYGLFVSSIEIHNWTFEGHAGQTVTIGCTPAPEDDLELDLRLYGPDEDLLAWDDNMFGLEELMATGEDDWEEGYNPYALIDRVELPVDGTYTIQVEPFGTVGKYTITTQ